MKKVLFLCTGNSCRSQMAHGIADKLYGSEYSFYSAGVEAHGVNAKAIEVMNEESINISHHESESLAAYGDTTFDVVVAVCHHAIENCPSFHKNTTVIQKQFDDPPKLAKCTKAKCEEIECFRKVRDDINQWIVEELIEHIEAD